MEDRLEPGLLDEQRGGQRAHAAAGPRPIRNVHQIDPADAQLPDGVEQVVGAMAARRQQLDADDEGAARERVRHPRPLGARHDRLRRDRRRGGWPRRPGRAAGGLRGAHRQPNLLDVVRRRPAAAAHQAHAGVRRIAGRTRPCTRASRDRGCGPSTSRGRPAFGCAERRTRRDPRDALERLEHRGRPDAAVQADDVRALAFELRHEQVRRRAVERVAVVFRRDLRDDRQARTRCAPRGSPRRSR